MDNKERWISKRTVDIDDIEYVFDIYEKSNGGLLAICESFPNMMLHYRRENEFETTVQSILPQFVKFLSGGD
jgi:hypothetical protein